jgi:hypothetical protein
MQDESRLEVEETTKNKDLPASTLQLQLAASIVDRLIERDGRRDILMSFWMTTQSTRPMMKANIWTQIFGIQTKKLSPRQQSQILNATPSGFQ